MILTVNNWSTLAGSSREKCVFAHLMRLRYDSDLINHQRLIFATLYSVQTMQSVVLTELTTWKNTGVDYMDTSNAVGELTFYHYRDIIAFSYKL